MSIFKRTVVSDICQACLKHKGVKAIPKSLNGNWFEFEHEIPFGKRSDKIYVGDIIGSPCREPHISHLVDSIERVALRANLFNGFFQI